MKVEIVIDQACPVPRLVIHASQITDELTETVDAIRRIAGDTSRVLVGYQSSEVFLLDHQEINTIYAENQKVFASTEQGIYRLKLRLYELEEMLQGLSFVRISNSEIVNFKRVKSLDLSIAGTISLKMKSGGKAFVARRYVDKIKKHLGM